MIYLDYAAATPMDPRVSALMKEAFERYGNPSSIHGCGQEARKAIDEARRVCAELLGAGDLHEIIFTGGGTESCNMAVFGAARATAKKHIIISAIEHQAVLESARYLHDNFGYELTEILPDEHGIIDPDDIEKAIRKDTALVSVMYVNNEIGTVQPVKKIGKMCRDKGVIFHTDACQAPGFLDIKPEHINVDLMSLNGSKIYGPKGVGLLYVRKGVQIAPLLIGGGQEFRMRGGTENTPAIAGFAKALQILLENSKKEAVRIEALRDDLLEFLLSFPGIQLNGSREKRIENNINIQMPAPEQNSNTMNSDAFGMSGDAFGMSGDAFGMSGDTLVMRLDLEGLAASSGSACSSGKTEPSHVILALGRSEIQAKRSIRFTLGRNTTRDEIEKAKEILKKVLPVALRS